MVGSNRDGAVDRKIATSGAAIAHRLGQFREIFQSVSIDGDVAQPAQEPLGDIGLEKAFGEMLPQRLERVGAELAVVELGAGGADHRQPLGQQSVGIEAVERRQQHAPRQVAGRPEEQQCGDLIHRVKRRMAARHEAWA